MVIPRRQGFLYGASEDCLFPVNSKRSGGIRQIRRDDDVALLFVPAVGTVVGDDGGVGEVGETDRGDDLEFLRGAEDVALPGLGHGAALDDGLADVGGGEAAVRIGTVGAHEAFGEVVGAEFFAGGAADDGFGGGADLTADEVDAEAASGQLESVGDGVGDIDGTVLGDEGDHGGGGGAGVDVDEVIGHDQGRRVSGDPVFFFDIDGLSVGDALFMKAGPAVDGHGAAEDTDQLLFFVQVLEVAADGGFRGLQERDEFCECDAAPGVEELQDLGLALFSEHVDLPFVSYRKIRRLLYQSFRLP